MKLDLNDLQPEEAPFSLSEKPGKTYILKKLSLRTQIWINQRFGTEKIKQIFENQSMPEVSEVAYHLLKDKSDFKTLEDFQEAIVNQKDRINLMTALLNTIGISQPVIDKLTGDTQGNAPSLSPPTGALSTT